MMTDTQKIDALTDLLSNAIHALNMKQYEIEDATQSHQCEVEADQFHQQMIDILHSEND
jgi:acid stress-induced BolA-like protein IbaG/YrbA